MSAPDRDEDILSRVCCADEMRSESLVDIANGLSKRFSNEREVADEKLKWGSGQRPYERTFNLSGRSI